MIKKVVDLVKTVNEYLQGKKTYIVAVLIAVIELLNQSGVEIPEWVLPVLAILGLGAVRSAIKKVGK